MESKLKGKFVTSSKVETIRNSLCKKNSGYLVLLKVHTFKLCHDFVMVQSSDCTFDRTF